jgi:4-diphosphocytidyl-2-C-methyl-D-erythritol kinase
MSGQGAQPSAPSRAASVEPVAEPAPAKLNLYLHVVGRRPDGYHLLDSLVAFASVGDRVTAEPAAAPAFAVFGPRAGEVPRDETNLAWRAAGALADALGRPLDAAVALTKTLPVAAGVGGGSADAAAVLRALARLWSVDAGDPRLADLAARLGADVPVCLDGRPRFVGGIGERLDAAPPVAGTPLVLVNPGQPLATPAVFKARAGAFSEPARFADAPEGPAALARRLAGRRNDLWEPARRLCPAIDAVLGELEGTGGCLLARMSGSGATCFGIYDSQSRADAAAEAIAALRPGWWVAPGRLL